MKTQSLSILIMLLLAGQGYSQGALERLERLFQTPDNNQTTQELPQPAETPQRGYLGAVLDQIKNSEQGGLVVVEVNRGGPAEKAGWRPGDQLQQVEGVRIKTLDQLAGILGNKKPGDQVRFTYIRGTGLNSSVVTLGSTSRPIEPLKPGDSSEDLPAPNAPGNLPAPGNPNDPLGLETPFASPPPKLGVRVIPLTEEYRRLYGLTVRRGALVESVTNNSIADRVGLQRGAVIVSFDGRRVDDPSELVNMVTSTRKDKPIEVNYYLGNRMYTSRLRLDGRPAESLNAPTNSSTQNDNRPPVLRLAERALERLGGNSDFQPRDFQPRPQGPDRSELSTRVTELEAEVEQLKAQIKRLEALLLEKQEQNDSDEI